MKNHQVRLRRFPEGLPVEDDFELVESRTPVLEEGQVLVRTRYLSLDPYMRSQIAGRHLSGSIQPGDTMRGETVGEVVESTVPGFQPGQLVRCFGGWQEASVHPAAELHAVSPEIKPPSYALSLLGMTGLTAWAGMIWQAGLKAGDRVLIPAVTGGPAAPGIR